MKKIREQLEGELKGLEFELRIELPREIKVALEHGDLRENAEYHAALERQALVKARIGQLRTRLGELNTLNLSAIPRDRIALGSTVELLDLDNDQEIRYELVLPEVADHGLGRISTSSPIGRSLVGKRQGDEVEVVIPNGRRRFEILDLTTVHDKPDEDS